ncbi:hypothetical protein J1N35_037742 [Gossypium stocksii]|uniref:Hcy-binding domain-containing protein n=1 Tax=Gossypium stocksii TaxID=47602 RepID=A0A9D3UKV2_9ROSI|nr:hypothetical protein J1N35_037742 [Gossypium stocksii]
MLWSTQLLHKYGNRSQNILCSFRTLTSVNSLQGTSVSKDDYFGMVSDVFLGIATTELCGCYGPGVNLDKLKDFYRRRLQVIVEAGPDLLAFETIPNKLEAQIFFGSVDGENAPSGESLRSALRY